MCRSEQRALHHALVELEAAERELDRRAGIISILADENAKLRTKRSGTISRWSETHGWHEVPDVQHWRAA